MDHQISILIQTHKQCTSTDAQSDIIISKRWPPQSEPGGTTRQITAHTNRKIWRETNDTSGSADLQLFSNCKCIVIVWIVTHTKLHQSCKNLKVEDFFQCGTCEVLVVNLEIVRSVPNPLSSIEFLSQVVLRTWKNGFHIPSAHHDKEGSRAAF